MSTPILVVTDHTKAAWAEGLGRRPSETRWRLLVLGRSSGGYLETNASRLGALNCEVLDLDRHSEAAEKDLQEFYPDFIHDFPRNVRLGGLTLLELLRRETGTNLWWLGETCEKGPLRGPLPSQLYALALLTRCLKETPYPEVWLALQNRDLARCLEDGLRAKGKSVRVFSSRSPKGWKTWLAQGTAFPALRLACWRWIEVSRHFLNRLVLLRAGLCREEGNGTEGRIGFFSRFPALWKNAFGANQDERYFKHLEEKIAAGGLTRYVVTISSWPWDLWRRRREISALFPKKGLLPLELYLKTSDLLKTLFGHRLLRRLLRFRRKMSGALHPEFLEWDIAPLWRSEILRTLTGPDLIQNLLLESSIRCLLEAAKFRVLMNPLEFQSMERALWSGAKGRTATLGMQHSTFCRNHFMYFFKEGELRDYAEGAVSDPSPVPDGYLVAGEGPRDILLRNGAPETGIGLCGALRYNDLRAETVDKREQAALRRKFGLPEGRTTVLVATPISRQESLDLVEALSRIVSKVRGEMTLLFKSHYHCRIDRRVNELFSKFSDRFDCRVLDVDGPLYDYIRASDAVLTSGSTVSMEAMALGRIPIVYQNPGLLNLSPLADFPGAAVFVSNPEALWEALEDLISGKTDWQAFLTHRSAAIRKTFLALDGRADERAIRFLKEKNLLREDDASGSNQIVSQRSRMV